MLTSTPFEAQCALLPILHSTVNYYPTAHAGKCTVRGRSLGLLGLNLFKQLLFIKKKNITACFMETMYIDLTINVKPI